MQFIRKILFFTVNALVFTGITSLIIVSTSLQSATSAERLMDPVVGEPNAESFNLDAIDGGSTSLNDYEGKFLLLNFWATWCAPCREEMPAMSNLHNQLSNIGLEVVGVHVGPSLEGVKRFLSSIPVDFTILIDKEMNLASWGVRGLPTTFLINPRGKLIYQAVGEREWDSPEMVKFLNELIVSYKCTVNRELSKSIKKKLFFTTL